MVWVDYPYNPFYMAEDYFASMWPICERRLEEKEASKFFHFVFLGEPLIWAKPIGRFYWVPSSS